MEQYATLEQTTDAVMMVVPVDFKYQTVPYEPPFDQVHKQDHRTPDQVSQDAQKEFDNAVKTLRDAGVRVLLLEHPHAGAEHEAIPDAVFCNNWITTHQDGTVCLYPMLMKHRRRETHLLDLVSDLFRDSRYWIRNMIRFGQYDEDVFFLEGTGAMVLDHPNKILYVCKSARVTFSQLNNFIETTRHFEKTIVFTAHDLKGDDIYHTDIVMSIGKNFAVIGAECIIDPDDLSSGYSTRDEVIAELSKHREMIYLTKEQVCNGLCGNILEVKSTKGEPLIVMSQRALSFYTDEQKQKLSKHGKLVVFDIDTIETYGNGGARCMLGECFLPTENPYQKLPNNLPGKLLELEKKLLKDAQDNSAKEDVK
jgi:hypothetical protein